MPTIDLTDTELVALTAAIQRLIDEDKFPQVVEQQRSSAPHVA